MIKTRHFILWIFFILLPLQSLAGEIPLTLTRQEYGILQEVQNLLAKKDWQIFEQKTTSILQRYNSNAPKHRLISLLVNRYVAQSWLNREKTQKGFEILKKVYAKENKQSRKLPIKYIQPLRWQLMYIALTLKQNTYSLNMLEEWFKFEEIPTDPAWYLLANLRSDKELWQKAKSPIEKAIELNNKNPAYYSLAVRIFYNLKLYPQAIDAQKNFMDLSAAYEEKNWNLLMQLQLADNRSKEALQSINIIWRNKFNADKKLLDYLIGSLLQYEQPLEAAKILQTWLVKNPKSKIKDWKTLVFCQIEARDYKAAEQTLEKMIKKFPKLKRKEIKAFWQQKANINYRQGNWLKASNDFKNLLVYTTKEEEQQRIKLMRARALVEAQKHSKALHELEPLLNAEDDMINKQAKYWIQYINTLTSGQ